MDLKPEPILHPFSRRATCGRGTRRWPARESIPGMIPIASIPTRAPLLDNR